MRIGLYIHTAFFEPALHLADALSANSEVHLLLEVSPSAWRLGAFDVEPQALPAGLVPADEVIGPSFPPAVRARWSNIASFHLVSHRVGRSLHPASLRVNAQVIRFLRRVGVDVLHLDDPDLSLRLALSRRSLAKIPVVLSVHDPVPHSGEVNWRKTLARRLLFGVVAHFVLFHHSGLGLFRDRHGIDAASVSVVRLAPYDLLRAYGAAADRSRPGAAVLFLGRMSPYKGLDTFLTAVERLAGEIDGLRAVVAGPAAPDYVPPSVLPLSGGATLDVRLGHLSNQELAELVRDSAVVVCPYRDASQSGVVLTAYALETPVVATRVGGLPEYVLDGETGLLVEPGDPAELADAIRTVLTDADVAERLRCGISRWRDSGLSWTRTADDLRSIYGRAVTSFTRRSGQAFG